jgi:Flp pilus assembly protein TadB
MNGRRGRVTVALAVVAMAAVLGLGAGPAAAAPPRAALALSNVRVEPGLVRLLVTPTWVPGADQVDPASISVAVGDQTLSTEAAVATDLTGATARVLTVVLDLNQDSSAAYVAAAQAAATALAASVPPDVQLGLFISGNDATEVVAPTLDRAGFTQAVAGTRAAGGWDPVNGVDKARRSLAGIIGASERRLLLISDTRTAYTSDFDAAVGSSIGASGLGLEILTLGAVADSTGLNGLQQIADAAGGRLRQAANGDELAAMATDVAAAFRPTIAVTVTVPPAMAGQSHVLTVRAPGFDPVETTVVFAPGDGGPVAAPPSGPDSGLPGWLVYVVAACVFLAIVVLLLAVTWPRSANHARLKQIDQFGPGRTVSPPKERSGTERGGPITRALLAGAASGLRVGGLDGPLSRGLERAGVKLRPQEWVLLLVGLTVAGGALFGLLFGPVGAVFGVVVAVLGDLAYLSVRSARRARQFADQLPDGLQLVIGSLRSGFSLSQALESLVRESPDPLAAEFGRAVAEHRLGADLSDALDRLAKRNGSEDLAWAVMAVRIQRDVGGNLAEVLQTSVDTMRERDRLRRHVRALSAEGRLSAWVLGVVPVVLGAFMVVYRRSYIAPLFNDIRGIAMLGVGSLLFVIGVVWMTRIVRVEP